MSTGTPRCYTYYGYAYYGYAYYGHTYNGHTYYGCTHYGYAYYGVIYWCSKMRGMAAGQGCNPMRPGRDPIAPYALHPMHQAVPLLHLGISMCQVRYRRYLAAILRYLSPQVRGKTAGPGAPPATLEAPPPPPPPPPPMPPSDLPPGWQQAADPTTGTAAGWRVAPWDIYIYVYTCICVPSWARHGSAARPPTLLGPTR